jgi:hypothetical protein
MKMVEKIAAAIKQADIGYNLRLTRLVDDVSEYTLTYADGQTHIFEDIDDGYAHIADRRRKLQADLILRALEVPTEGMKMAGAQAITLDHMRKAANYDAACDAWSAMIAAAREE